MKQIRADWTVIQEVDPDRFRVYTIIHYLSILGIVAHTLFIPLFLYLETPMLSAFNIFSVYVWVTARSANARGERDKAIALVTLEVVSHALFATFQLGWSSGFQLYLIPMIPFTIFNQKLTKRFLVGQTIVLLALYIWLYRYATHAPEWLSPALLYKVYLSNSFIVFLALGLLSFYFRQASLHSEGQLIEVANVDPLTKLPNRRHLLRVLKAEQDKSLSTGSGFVVAMGDIDHFKTFNDTHGHECGDEVLKQVARTLRTTVRDADVVGRWGGEEFLLILRTSDLEVATSAVERVRKVLAESLMEFESQSLTITMTFGVALFEPSGTIDDLLRASDDLLYQGKAAGRNTVMAQTPPPFTARS